MRPFSQNITFKISAPFGSPLIGRTYQAESPVKYRYSFNGKENDLENNTQDYGMRIFNGRLGRFLSVDPLQKKFPWWTPYQFAGNTPIWASDLDGLEAWFSNDGVNSVDVPKNADGSYNVTTLFVAAGPLSESYIEDNNLSEYPTINLPSVEIQDLKQTVPASINTPSPVLETTNETKVKDQVAAKSEMISPVSDPIISSEQSAARPNPTNKSQIKPHNGIDIIAKTKQETNGKAVVAPADGRIGTVKLKTDGNGAGNRVTLIDEEGKKHSFFHLQDGSIVVKPGQPIKQGDPIGKIGTTGHSTGPHLHYEIRDENGTVLNPREANPGLKDAPKKDD